MIPFWLSYDSWFQTHGILLYPLSRRWFPPEDQPQDPVLPFAHRLSWKGEKIHGLGLQVCAFFLTIILLGTHVHILSD